MKKKSFAIIGDPISHSLSPVLHNYWFQKHKIDAEYSLLNIKVSELKDVEKKVKEKKISGINMLDERADARWGNDPNYQKYRKNTSVLILRPPQK